MKTALLWSMTPCSLQY